MQLTQQRCPGLRRQLEPRRECFRRQQRRQQHGVDGIRQPRPPIHLCHQLLRSLGDGEQPVSSRNPNHELSAISYKNTIGQPTTRSRPTSRSTMSLRRVGSASRSPKLTDG